MPTNKNATIRGAIARLSVIELLKHFESMAEVVREPMEAEGGKWAMSESVERAAELTQASLLALFPDKPSKPKKKKAGPVKF